jgi:glycosyltransferase involved in cell wall biosynthesis
LLYICIPAHNESTTIGVLLWRIRKVFQGYSREYEVIVYDDGSTDGTSDILQPYLEVCPLTVLRETKHLGYGPAVERLCREVSRRTRYPRRDAMIVMQGDFTDQPEHLPELVKRFEGGADIVIGERDLTALPRQARRLRALAPWVLRFSLAITGVDDPFSSFRLYRISLIRELLKSIGEKPLISSEGWAANVELLMHTVPLARRVERVTLAPRYDVRTRPTRVRPLADAMALYRFGRTVKGRGIVARTTAQTVSARQPAPQPSAARI